MRERIDRSNDEGKYQPPVHSDRIKELHRLKEESGIPMTVHLDRAIREYVTDYLTKKLVWIEPETWEEHVEDIEALNGFDMGRFEDLGDWKQLIDYEGKPEDNPGV